MTWLIKKSSSRLRLASNNRPINKKNRITTTTMKRTTMVRNRRRMNLIKLARCQSRMWFKSRHTWRYPQLLSCRVSRCMRRTRNKLRRQLKVARCHTLIVWWQTSTRPKRMSMTRTLKLRVKTCVDRIPFITGKLVRPYSTMSCQQKTTTLKRVSCLHPNSVLIAFFRVACLFRTCCCFYYLLCCCICCEKSKAVTKQTFVKRFQKWLNLDKRFGRKEH